MTVATEVALTLPSAGFVLRGMIHKPVGPNLCPAVVLCHGYFQSNRIGPLALYVQLARALASDGIACLRFDCAGFGESDGNYLDASYASLATDLRSALEALRRVEGVDVCRLGLIGHSMGGNIAIEVASSNPLVKVLCLLSPNPTETASEATLFTGAHLAELRAKGMTERKGIPATNLIYEPINAGISFKRAGTVTADGLIIYGDLDPYYSASQYLRLSNAFSVPVELLGIPSADHNFLPLKTRAQLITRLVSWISGTFAADQPPGYLGED